jgi:hypothetical protein
MELGKNTYGGTRGWLDPNHAYRHVGIKDHFNGLVEDCQRLNIVSVKEQLQHAADYEAWKETSISKGSVGDPSKIHGVKRRSIFFILTYWKVSSINSYGTAQL